MATESSVPPLTAAQADDDLAIPADLLDSLTAAPEEAPGAEPEKPRVSDSELLRQFGEAFSQGRLTDALAVYGQLANPQSKCLVIDRLVERVTQFRLTPVLAIGASESDKHVFRHLMHSVLAADRATVCDEIVLEALPAEQQRVGAMVLSHAGPRATAKLLEALKIDNPVVRGLALHGLARAGEAALVHIPLFAQFLHHDPEPRVRLAAARALEAMQTVQAYDALAEVTAHMRLDPAVAKILDAMRQRFDPRGTRLARNVDIVREKTSGKDPRVQQRVREAERLLETHRGRVRWIKEQAERDPVRVAARKRHQLLTKAIVIACLALGTFTFVGIRYGGTISSFLHSAFEPRPVYEAGD